MSTLPEICIQQIAGSGGWWTKQAKPEVRRGSLVFSFVPHVDQTPLTFTVKGRKDAEQHDSAIVEVAPMRVDSPLKQTDLPVAAMPLNHNEVWAAYRAKRRPCLVLGRAVLEVTKDVVRGMANKMTAPTWLVAPYYGANRNGVRSGYRPEFVSRVQQCEYLQFVWDQLPHTAGEASILRLDHLQPIGAHHDACKPSGWELSPVAMTVMDELLNYHLFGKFPDDSLVAMYREEVEELIAV